MQRFTEKDRLCLPVPLFHCFGCVLGVLAAVSHGTAMVILETFNPVQVMASVEQERCTALYGVPTMFIAVLDHKCTEKDYPMTASGKVQKYKLRELAGELWPQAMECRPEGKRPEANGGGIWGSL